MEAFLTILFILLCLVSAVGTVLFFHSRKILREQKNYERGLKMVPLLIHLPPPSDDIQNTGRDVRDITEENISKAQVLYSIIASTIQKGFKSRFYGQRHFAFEIVASHGFVYFYAAVPIALMDVVKQAVVSAYPSARLEEVAEHNIFSPVGKINATLGGELMLKDNFAYPIATFQDVKRDGMQSLLNALSTLDKEDGAGIQILMRPAEPGWRKSAQGVASKKRKGKEGAKGAAQAGAFAKDLATAFFKPPDEKKDGGSDKPELSAHEQSMLDAIDQKTSYPGYEVLIRVVASSNISQRSQVILNNIVASFALFDAPGRNGFKFTASKDIESFVTAYIMRFFPQENNLNILNSVELATIFHFPDQKNIPTSQLERQASKQVDGPRNISDEGLFLGYNVFRGVKKQIRLAENDRRRHMYLVGQTGTGKSTLLENLALQDMLNGKGFAFIDPHGDTAEKLLSMVPRERTEDVIYFCPADMDYPLGLNLFEFDSPDQKDFLIQEAINMLYKLYDPQHTGIIGPRYEHWFRNAALTIMANPDGGTFIDIPKVFTDKQYEKQLKQYVTDQTVLDFWNKEMAQTSDYHKSEVLGWFVSKFGAFLSNEMMRNIIGQSKSSFSLRDVMDNGKILLVNLSKGRTGELNSKLLGMIFVMKFQAAAMSRANVPEDQRKDFSLYVDEFQNFSTDSFATILSEARKYRLNLIVANQFTTQLSEEIRDAVFGNIGTVISYRVGTNDAEFLAKQFAPVFDMDDLQRIPNYNAVVRMLIGGIPAQSFSMAAMPPLGKPNQKLMEALKQLSAAKYGRPKGKVEKDIFARLKSSEEPKPTFGAQPGVFGAAGAPNRAFGQAPGARPAGYPAAPPAAGARPPAPRPASTGSSFLDEWLAKRGATGAARPNVSAPPKIGPAAQSGYGPAAARPAVAGQPTDRPLVPTSSMTAATHEDPFALGMANQPHVGRTKKVIEPPADIAQKMEPALPPLDEIERQERLQQQRMQPQQEQEDAFEPAPLPKLQPLPPSTGMEVESGQVIAPQNAPQDSSVSGISGKDEVSGIAAELKQVLDSKAKRFLKSNKPAKPAEPQPVLMVRQDEEGGIRTKTAQESEESLEEIALHLPKKPIVRHDQQPSPDDTIYIDADGNFHIRTDDEPEKKDDKKDGDGKASDATSKPVAAPAQPHAAPAPHKPEPSAPKPVEKPQGKVPEKPQDKPSEKPTPESAAPQKPIGPPPIQIPIPERSRPQSYDRPVRPNQVRRPADHSDLHSGSTPRPKPVEPSPAKPDDAPVKPAQGAPALEETPEDISL